MAPIDLGPVDLEDGTHRVCAIPGEPPWKTLILTRSGGQWRVYRNLCAHLPVPLDGGAGELPPGDELVCSTHGARFRVSDGRCVSGPCPGKSLQAVAFVEREGRLFALEA